MAKEIAVTKRSSVIFRIISILLNPKTIVYYKESNVKSKCNAAVNSLGCSETRIELMSLAGLSRLYKIIL